MVFLTALTVIAKLCRLMLPDLPQTIEPLRLAKAGKKIAGQYVLNELKRLNGLLHDNTGFVSFMLEFTRDEEQGLYCVTGEIKANLHAVCQRCLGSMELQINSPVYLGIVNRQTDISKLPDKYEPLILGEDPVSLLELIEDELLLAIPMSPMHELNRCSGAEILSEINDAAPNRPFAVLKEALIKGHPGLNQRRKIKM